MCRPGVAALALVISRRARCRNGSVTRRGLRSSWKFVRPSWSNGDGAGAVAFGGDENSSEHKDVSIEHTQEYIKN